MLWIRQCQRVMWVLELVPRMFGMRHTGVVSAELVLSWILRDPERMQVLLTWLDLEWYPTQLKDCVRYAPAVGATM